MRAPRLNIGIFADGDNPIDFFDEMAKVGHNIRLIDDVTEINSCELIIISVAEDRLAETVLYLSGFARRDQMFLHTCLVHGLEIMDPLELAGCVVMAASPISSHRWVTGAVDELGETIVGLLAGELGASILSIEDSQRGAFAAALDYARFLGTLAQDARNVLDAFLNDVDLTQHIIDDSIFYSEPLPPLNNVIARYEAIEDPGVKRLFKDLARRQAEISRAQDIELWAIQKEQL